MIYQHQYFQLDTKSKKVLDENGKELRLTGNAYRVLVFLCTNKNATVTDIGQSLDWAKDYEENHLRQYKYKINTVIGRDVIEYKNGVYSLIGDIKEADKLTKNDRNTDLLQGDDIKSNQVNEKFEKRMKFLKLPVVISICMLALSIATWPSAFYTLLKIVITGTAIYCTYYFSNKSKKDFVWIWPVLAIAILFNPFIQVYIKNKFAWKVIDILSILFFIGILLKETKFNINRS